jgi:glycerol-3-phosphate acyltransferase PlsY
VSMLLSASLILAAYLLGSVSFAVVISRIMGLQDPRAYGSGNPGATNVLRSGSKLAALLTLVGDTGKGALAVVLARALGNAWGGVDDVTLALVALAAFAGHLYPVFFRFQGGKGVATFLGAVLALFPWLGLLTCAVWLVVAGITRYSSLASMLSAASAPILFLLTGGPVGGSFIALAVMAALLIVRHRSNIAKLRAGQERKIGAKAQDGGAAG